MKIMRFEIDQLNYKNAADRRSFVLHCYLQKGL